MSVGVAGVAADGSDRPWILADGRRTSHADLRARAARAASGFRDLGIGDGDAVALLLGNGTPFLEASLAATLAGAHPVPIHTGAAPDDVLFVLGDCGAKLLVAGAEHLAVLRPSLPPGLPCIVVEDAPSWEGWAARHPSLADAGPTRRGAVIYTSGTTGRPKGIRRAPAPAGAQPIRALRVYGFDRPGHAVTLVDGPLFHSVPNAYARLALGAGADIVLRRRIEPEATLEAIAEHRVTHLHVVPGAMARLLALPEAVRRRHDLSSLRHVVHGAAPCPPHLKRAMVAWWGPVIHEYYGSTETGLLTLQDSVEALAKPGGVGRALPGIALHILDADGHALPPGEIGGVYAGSDTLHDFTYIGQADRRAAIGRRDLVTAGDLGWMDAEGTLFLAGRAAEALWVGGATVHPAAVEAALSALPGVADCAVVGVPGQEGGDELVACVSALPGTALDAEALREALVGRVAPEAVPRRIVVIARMPREDSGKLFKRRLTAILAGPPTPAA